MNESFEQLKVKNIIGECLLHEKRINYAKSKLQGLMPLSKESYCLLNDEDIEAFDQFLFRFGKLQDTIGQRLFNAILALLGEPHKQMSFIDKLNRLEQLKIISDADDWMKLRVIRNQLAHEYETEPASLVTALNGVFEHSECLFQIFNELQSFIKKYL